MAFSGGTLTHTHMFSVRMGMLGFNPALRRQSKADLCELEVNQRYKVRPILKKIWSDPDQAKGNKGAMMGGTRKRHQREPSCLCIPAC